MIAPAQLSTRTRAVFARLIHRANDWVTAVGTISPDDERGRRFGALGTASCLSFPPGPLFGEALISIGRETLVGPHVSLTVGLPGERLPTDDEPRLRIGDRCNIGRGSSIAARLSIVIEDDVTTGPNVYITDHNHGYADVDVPIGLQWLRSEPVRIGAGSWLGAGAVVLPGADIGRNVVVAAGSVVRGHVPDHSVVAGVPARSVRRHVAGQGWVPPLEPNPESAPADWPRTTVT